MTMSKKDFNRWKTQVQVVLEDISIPWEIHLIEDHIFKDVNNNGRLYIQIQFDDVDNTGKQENYRSHCRKWSLSPHMPKQEVVRTVYKAYKLAVDHEADEKFKYRGKMIYGPHVSPDALCAIADMRETREGEDIAGPGNTIEDTIEDMIDIYMGVNGVEQR